MKGTLALAEKVDEARVIRGAEELEPGVDRRVFDLPTLWSQSRKPTFNCSSDQRGTTPPFSGEAVTQITASSRLPRKQFGRGKLKCARFSHKHSTEFARLEVIESRPTTTLDG